MPDFHDTGFVALRGDYLPQRVAPSSIENWYGGNYGGGSILVRDDGVVLATYTRGHYPTVGGINVGGDIMVSHIADEATMRSTHNSAAANEFQLTSVQATGTTYKSRLLKLRNGDFLLFVYNKDNTTFTDPHTRIQLWRCTNGDGTHAGDWTFHGDIAETSQGQFNFTNQGLGEPLQLGGGRILLPLLYPYRALIRTSIIPLIIGPDTLFDKEGICGLACLRSDDDGASWTMARIFPDTETLPFDPLNQNKIFNLEWLKGVVAFNNGIYVGAWQNELHPGGPPRFGTFSFLFRSDDGGESWKEITQAVYFPPYPSVDANHLGMFSGGDGWNYLVRGGDYKTQPTATAHLTVYRAANTADLPNDKSWITNVADVIQIDDPGGGLIQTPGLMTDQSPTASGISLAGFVEHGYRWITYQAVNGGVIRSPDLAAAKQAGFAPEWGVGVWGVVYSQSDFFAFGVRLAQRAIALGAGHVIVDAEECLKFTRDAKLGQRIVDGLRAGGWSGPVHLSTLAAPDNAKTGTNPGGNDYGMDLQSFLDTGGGILPQDYPVENPTAYLPANAKNYLNFLGVDDTQINHTIGTYAKGAVRYSGADYVPLLHGAAVANNFSIFLAETTTEADLVALDEFTGGSFVSSDGAFWTWIGGPMGDDGTECIWVSDQSGYIYFLGSSHFNQGQVVYLNGAPGNGGPGGPGRAGHGVHFVGQF